MKSSFKAFIVISVLLNVLMAAMIAGHFARPYVEVTTNHYMPEVVATIPEDNRANFAAAITGSEEKNKVLRENLKNAYRKATDLLEAQPFDSKAYLLQLEAVHDLSGRILRNTAEAVVGMAEKLPPDERTIMAEGILKHRELMHHPCPVEKPL